MSRLAQMENDGGGSVLVYAGAILLARGPRLLPLVAKSAATMWLGYRHSFVDSKSWFGFHKVARDYTGIATQIYRAHLRAAHPELLEWFDDVGGKSDEMTYLTGDKLIKRGWAISIEDYR